MPSRFSERHRRTPPKRVRTHIYLESLVPSPVMVSDIHDHNLRYQKQNFCMAQLPNPSDIHSLSKIMDKKKTDLADV